MGCLRKKKKGEIKLKNLDIRRAPEPTEINWNNMHINNRTKIKFRAQNCIVYLMAIVVSCFSIYYFQADVQIPIKEQKIKIRHRIETMSQKDKKSIELTEMLDNKSY